MNGKNTDPYNVEMLDVLNEVGGAMKIRYHTANMTVTKEMLQILRDNGSPTDVMTCIVAGLAASGMRQEEIITFLEKADANGAAPNVIFEAKEGESLNINSKEENPMVDMLVQTLCEQKEVN